MGRESDRNVIRIETGEGGQLGWRDHSGSQQVEQLEHLEQLPDQCASPKDPALEFTPYIWAFSE